MSLYCINIYNVYINGLYKHMYTYFTVNTNDRVSVTIKLFLQ